MISPKPTHTAAEPVSLQPRSIPQGVRIARMVGVAAGGALVLQALYSAFGGSLTGFEAYFAAYGLILMCPFGKIKNKAWFYRAFAVLVLASAAFVFCLMFQFLFYAWDMHMLDRKPRIPGAQGTLVFLCLMQVPTVLFQRRPELLD